MELAVKGMLPRPLGRQMAKNCVCIAAKSTDTTHSNPYCTNFRRKHGASI